MIMNLYMGVTIILTTLMSQLTIMYLPDLMKALFGAISFSGYTGLLALLVSKTLIGGVFEDIPLFWIMATTILCIISGIIGTLFAKKILKQITRYSEI